MTKVKEASHAIWAEYLLRRNFCISWKLGVRVMFILNLQPCQPLFSTIITPAVSSTAPLAQYLLSALIFCRQAFIETSLVASQCFGIQLLLACLATSLVASIA